MSANNWILETDDPIGVRYPYRRDSKAPTEHVSFRIPEKALRRLDEILAKRIDPSYKTRSDILVDAVILWLQDWDIKGKDDGAGGLLAAESKVEQGRQRQTHQKQILENCEIRLDECRKNDDVEGIEELLGLLLQVKLEFMEMKAPPTIKKKLESIIGGCRSILYK